MSVRYPVYSPYVPAFQNWLAYTRSQDARRAEESFKRLEDLSRSQVNRLMLLRMQNNEHTSLLHSEAASELPSYTLSDFHYDVAIGNERKVNDAITSNGVRVFAIDDDGRNSFHIAAEYGQVKILALLLKFRHFIEAKDKLGRTPLAAAAEFDRKEAVSKLLEEGANPDNPNKLGETPLFIAARKSSFIVFSLLATKSKNLNAARNDGLNAFAIAAYGPDGEQKMHFLHANGVDIRKVSNEGVTAFHTAAEMGIQFWVEFFVKNDTPIDLRTKNGFTPLLYAIKRGHLATAQFLQRSGADTKAVTQKGWSIVHCAVFANVACVNYALSLYKDYKSENTHTLTPLHFVVMIIKDKPGPIDPVAIASVLLRYGANVNALASCTIKSTKNNRTTRTTVTHWTPLHQAALCNNIPLIKWLLRNGADGSIRDSSWCNPRAHAKRLGFKEAERLLLQAEKAHSCFPFFVF